MTIIELGILLGLVGLIGGLLARKQPLGRALWMISVAVLVVLLGSFGAEIAKDLL